MASTQDSTQDALGFYLASTPRLVVQCGKVVARDVRPLDQPATIPTSGKDPRKNTRHASRVSIRVLHVRALQCA